MTDKVATYGELGPFMIFISDSWKGIFSKPLGTGLAIWKVSLNRYSITWYPMHECYFWRKLWVTLRSKKNRIEWFFWILICLRWEEGRVVRTDSPDIVFDTRTKYNE